MGLTVWNDIAQQQPTESRIIPLSVNQTHHTIHSRHFIEANTKAVDIEHLRDNCIVPVFSKDNELTISHQMFIETVLDATYRMFSNEAIDTPDIIVSHIYYKYNYRTKNAGKKLEYNACNSCNVLNISEIPPPEKSSDGRAKKYLKKVLIFEKKLHIFVLQFLFIINLKLNLCLISTHP